MKFSPASCNFLLIPNIVFTTLFSNMLILYSIFTVHFSSIDNVIHQLNAPVYKTLKYSKKFDKKPRHVSAHQ
jgi:hypothetical protein